MSSPQSIKINFFDINGEYREDVPIDTEQNFLNLESPMRIIDQYISENFLQNLKKTSENQSITKYKFSYEISPNNLISITCDIINNFSVSHQSILDSNGYVVFCNLESKSTFELLDKIVEYQTNSYMQMDEITRRTLELTRTKRMLKRKERVSESLCKL